MSSTVFVVNVERSGSTEVVGVFLSEKEAKAASVRYTEEQTDLSFKKKQTKSDDARRVVFLQDTKESPVAVTMNRVSCNLPQEKSKKAKKDPNAPKKPLSAFMIFSGENRSKILEANPGTSFGDTGRLLGEAWKKLNDKQREVFTKKAVDAKAQYTVNFAAYTETLTAATETVVETVAPEVAVEVAVEAPKKRAKKVVAKAD